MNRDQFIALLRNPESLNESTLAGLSEIVEEYPFFQAARMLLVKNLHLTESIKYNSELKQSAAYIYDRKKLFFLLHDLTSAAITEEPSELVVETVKEEVSSQEKLTVKSKPVITDRISTTLASQDFFQADDDLYNFSKIKPQVEDAEDEEHTFLLPTADLLDYEMTSSSAYSLPDVEDDEEPYFEKSHSFSDWLQVLRQKSYPTEQQKENKPNKGMDLIENFLNAKPKIIPTQLKEVEKEDLSKQESVYEEEIMTETLAGIYVKQKNYEKAKSIFAKLSLKYPEKNVYFARRISDLEKLINK